jgi:acyl-CoA thioester hydrolase
MRTAVRVRWTDLDAFGHVNNAVYLTYLEEGRDRLVDSTMGDTFGDFVVAHISIDYRSAITEADEHVFVESLLVNYGRSSFRTAERVTVDSGRLAAEAQTVLVALDRTTGSARPLTDGEVKALETLGPENRVQP